MYHPHNKVLDDKDVLAIRERHFGGIEKVKELEIDLKNLRNRTKQVSIARDYNVSGAHVYRILRNKARIQEARIAVRPVKTERPVKLHLSYLTTDDKIAARIKISKLEASHKKTKRNREIAAANNMRVGHKLPYSDVD